MQSLVFLSYFFQKLLKESFGGSARPLLVKEWSSLNHFSDLIFFDIQHVLPEKKYGILTFGCFPWSQIYDKCNGNQTKYSKEGQRRAQSNSQCHFFRFFC